MDKPRMASNEANGDIHQDQVGKKKSQEGYILNVFPQLLQRTKTVADSSALRVCFENENVFINFENYYYEVLEILLGNFHFFNDFYFFFILLPHHHFKSFLMILTF